MRGMERLLEIAYMPMLNIEARGVSVNQEVESNIYFTNKNNMDIPVVI